MSAQEYIIIGIEYLLYGYFAISSFYIFIFAFAGHFYKKRRGAKSKTQNRIAVLIPAYREDAVIVEVAKSALQQEYSSKKFDVVVIADTLKQKTINELNALPIIVKEVSFETSTKSKALNNAMSTLKNSYDNVVILDADNIMESDFLQKINDAFQNGYQIVQGHRKAKNLNTSFAILDAASEEINNHIFRKGHRVLGLSSGLIGSGMAFDYKLFKSMMSTVTAIGGFDKELEFKFAERRIAIEYLQDAVVLDEKIQKSSDFSNQRKRWLSTQFVYLKKYFRKGCKELFLRGNITFLIACTYCLLVFAFGIYSNVSVYLSLLNLLITVTAFVLSLPKSFYNINTLKALLSLPSAFVRMALLLFKLKGANKKFIHTSHGSIKN